MDFCKQAHLFVFGVLFFVGCILAFSPATLFAKIHNFATVASPVIISGDANDHDIISYHSSSDVYRVSGAFADESMFGVIVDDPVLYMESEVAMSENARPVVRHGEAIVNVSTLGGEISAGDIITTSPISGIGQKAEKQDATYILGFALDDMEYTGQSIIYEGEEYRVGTVPTALRIGPYLTKEGVAFLTVGKEYLTGTGELSGFGTVGQEDDREEVTAFKVFRYILAAVIAVSSIIVSIGRFGEAFKQSVVSVGRNPLARGQIRSILFWNVVLIILVSGSGLAIAAAIILVP